MTTAHAWMQGTPRCTVYVSIPYFKTVLWPRPPYCTCTHLVHVCHDDNRTGLVIEESSSQCGSIRRSSSVASQHLGRGHHHPRASSLLTNCGDHVWGKRQTTDQVKKLYITWFTSCKWLERRECIIRMMYMMPQTLKAGGRGREENSYSTLQPSSLLFTEKNFISAFATRIKNLKISLKHAIAWPFPSKITCISFYSSPVIVVKFCWSWSYWLMIIS